MVRSQGYLQEEQDVVYRVKTKNLWIYRVRAFDAYPHLKHAIFTRRGGVSLSPFDSLNLSVSVGDNPQTVQKNFASACRAVGVEPEQTVSSHLIHGADVVTINHTNRQKVMDQADALITAELEIHLFMRFGDCTPLLFFDPVRQAVGLAHAGWRGTMKNVAGATIAAMTQRLGCQAENIMAVIGPAIGPCCYEVGLDVIAAADQAFDEPEQFFTQRSNRANHAHFNLGSANQQQLREAGVTHIIQSNLCTACRTDDFFSHRAEKGQTGRFGVVIGIEERAE
ncbi:MAG: peptidoglycan editing factor PgeF [Anaerolineae bacterium]|nr:peptidoglycan editing factor PgeF [Anaerolineae bacterium]